MKYLIVAFVVITCLTASICIGSDTAESPTVTEIVYRETTDWNADKVKTMIRYIAGVYDFPFEELDYLAFKESSYRTEIIGDGGKAYGTFQYHDPTWTFFQKKYGLENLKKDNPVDQTIMTIYALKDNQHCHWTPLHTKYNCKKH